MPRPVWTTPPWTRAPVLLWREPTVAIAIAITSALLGMASAALPLYLSSSASAAVTLQANDVCPSQLGDDAAGSGPVGGIAAVTSSLKAVAASTLLHAGAAAQSLGAPIVSMTQTGLSLKTAGKPPSRVQLATSTNAISHIDIVSQAGGGGVWISDDVAAALGVHPGGSVGLTADGATTEHVRVAGIYRDLVGTALPNFWCTQVPIFGLPDSNSPPPPVVLADQPTMLRLLKPLHVRTINYFDFQRFFTGGTTLPAARRVAAGATTFARRVGESSGERVVVPTTRGNAAGGFSLTASPPVRLTQLVGHAGAVKKSLRGSIVPVSLAAAIVAALLVGLAGSYWVDRRRIELRLLGIRGVGSLAVGLKAGLETVVPIVVGSVAGWGLAQLIVPILGPSSLLTTAARLQALRLAGAGAVVGLLLVGAVATVRTRSLLERPAGRRAPGWTKLPLELVGFGGALWAWRSLGEVSLEATGHTASHVPRSFLIFPLLLILSLAIFAGRLLAMLLGSGLPTGATKSSGPALWLAVRRLASGPQLVALLMLSATASIGILTYAAALTRSQKDTLYAKAEVFVGSDVSAQLLGKVRTPPELAKVSTIVATSTAGQVGANTVTLLGINPKTFAQGAYWNPAFSHSSLGDLLKQIGSSQGDTHTLPVIEVGSAVGIAGAMTFVAQPTVGTVQLHVLSTTPTFPGQNGNGPLLVTSRANLAKLPFLPTKEIWTRGNEAAVINDLDRAGDTAPVVVSRTDIVSATTFAAVGWTFSYLQSLGVLAGIATVGGLLLFLTTRARARGLAYVLSRRMGLRRADHVRSLAIELAVVLGLGGAAGAGIGWLAVEMAARHLNALPELAPSPLVVAPLSVLLGSAGALIFVWLLSVAWAQRAADRARPAELLRLDV